MPPPSSPPLGPGDTYQVDSDEFITDEESMHPDEYDELVTEGKSAVVLYMQNRQLPPPAWREGRPGRVDRGRA